MTYSNKSSMKLRGEPPFILAVTAVSTTASIANRNSPMSAIYASMVKKSMKQKGAKWSSQIKALFRYKAYRGEGSDTVTKSLPVFTTKSPVSSRPGGKLSPSEVHTNRVNSLNRLSLHELRKGVAPAVVLKKRFSLEVLLKSPFSWQMKAKSATQGDVLRILPTTSRLWFRTLQELSQGIAPYTLGVT